MKLRDLLDQLGDEVDSIFSKESMNAFYKATAKHKTWISGDKKTRIKNQGPPKKGFYWHERQNKDGSYYYIQVKNGQKPPPHVAWSWEKMRTRTMAELEAEAEAKAQKRRREQKKKEEEERKRQAKINAKIEAEKACIRKTNKARSSFGKYIQPKWFSSSPKNGFGAPMDPRMAAIRKQQREAREAKYREQEAAMAAYKKKKEEEKKKKAKKAQQAKEQEYRPKYAPNGAPYPPGYWDKVYGTTSKKTVTKSVAKPTKRSCKPRSSYKSKSSCKPKIYKPRNPFKPRSTYKTWSSWKPKIYKPRNSCKPRSFYKLKSSCKPRISCKPKTPRGWSTKPSRWSKHYSSSRSKGHRVGSASKWSHPWSQKRCNPFKYR